MLKKTLNIIFKQKKPPIFINMAFCQKGIKKLSPNIVKNIKTRHLEEWISFLAVTGGYEIWARSNST